MKSAVILLAGLVLFVAPLCASAQTVDMSNDQFLSQLQALETEVASLEATLKSLITTVTGPSASLSLPTSFTATSSSSGIISSFITPSVSNTPDFSTGADIGSQLLQAIAPSVSSANVSSTTVIVAPVIGTTLGTSPAPSNQSTIGNQLDPSCISSIFSSGTVCGGLYSCGMGANQYWSTQACSAN